MPAKSNRPRKRTILKRVVQFLLTSLAIIVVVPMIGAVVQCRMWAPKQAADFPTVTLPPQTAELPDYARPEEQTYLTLPEWYVVFNADEYGAFLADQRPSRFPYFQTINQFWSTYYTICRQTRDSYPFNGEYHIIIGVVGVSFTVETAVRGAYEKTIGRLFEGFGRRPMTQEELYAQQVAVEYGEFIHTIPWFKFPFWEKLQGLWAETDLWGPRLLRKWERKIVLSAEYAIKAGYGALLNSGRDAVLSELNYETQMWVDNFAAEAIAPLEAEGVRLVKALDGDEAIIALPRYEPVTVLAPELAAAGIEFEDISGNDDILLTILAPAGVDYTLPGDLLQALPYPSDPAVTRLIVSVPVADLHTVLRGIDSSEMTLEHIFDY